MEIQDLATQTIAVAAHHIGEPRPAGPPGWAPDDGTRPYAVAELRRLASWSLDQNPALRDQLTQRPSDDELRRRAAGAFAAELARYPHLVSPVAAFVGRVLAPPPPPPPARPTVGRWVLVAGLGALVLVLAGAATLLALPSAKPGVAAAATGPATDGSGAARARVTLVFGAIDLDQQPPSTGAGFDLQAEFGPQLILTNQANGAPYSGSGPATKQECSDDLARNGVGATGLVLTTLLAPKVSVGMAFCVSTTVGNTAYLKVTATTDSTITADVTIWGR